MLSYLALIRTNPRSFPTGVQISVHSTHVLHFSYTINYVNSFISLYELEKAKAVYTDIKCATYQA